ncbi:MAG: ABC transporter permease [Planctomycetes bacterium]|nr:ABC transporter permease [Planctomycetota bacterium]
MIGFVERRLLQALLVLLGVSVVVFTLVRLTPGDPARVALGKRATETQVEEARRRMGLDRPLPLQYLVFLRRVVLEGDLGRSYRTARPVLSDFAERLPATFELASAALALALALGVPAGVVAGVRRGGWLDHACQVGALVGVSMPVFWLGYLLILALGGVLDYAGRISDRTVFAFQTHFYLAEALARGAWPVAADCLRHLALPALALSTIPMAVVARITRSAVAEVAVRDFVRTARAKGLPARAVVLRHVLPNALIPVVTIAGLQFGYLLGGAVLTETVFSWPGLGTYTYDAIANKDLPAIQGVVLLFAVVFVAVNTAVDLAYAALDPRVRHGVR